MFRKLYVPRKHRHMVGQVINEITRQPRHANKTDVYWRGVCDGVSLVRTRASQKGIQLNEIEQPMVQIKILRVR